MYRSKFIRFFLIFCAVGVLAGCASTSNVKYTKWTTKQLTATKLPKFDIPIVINDRVVAWIDYFQGPGHRHFARYLARSGRYIPEMQEILRKNGLPQDLVYLALIESGFSAKAYSRAKAAGHWQFISATGKRYGLSINNWTDERRHEDKSTVAAAKYLRDLYDEFGDWYLAMAAYNAGEGKIARAVQMTGTKNFWEMIERDRHYIRTETRDYVPKFIAAAIIAKSPERFGFDDVVYDQPVESEQARVDSQTDLDVIARCADVPVSVIEDLNPELIKGVTPATASDYLVNLPKGSARKFEVAYAKVPASERVMVVRHNVKRGESIGRIAKRYGVSVREILAANDLRSAGSVKKGMTLIIPTGGAAKEMATYASNEDSEKPSGKLLKYKVKRGDTLSTIAENYGVSKSALKKWNNLGNGRVRVGSVLKIYGAEEDVTVVATNKKVVKNKAKSYVVRRGESWSRIAQKNGVSINDLKEWNPITAKKGLKAGQKLRIYARVEETAVASGKATKPADVTVASVPVNMSTSDRLEPPSQSVEKTPDQSELLSMKTDLPPSSAPDAVASAVTTETMPMPAGGTISYKIQNGDTIWDIAQKYKVSVKSIQEVNGLGKNSHRKLKPGDQITIKTP